MTLDEVINPRLKIRYDSEPFPLWVLDHFLIESVVERLQAEWLHPGHKSWHKGYQEIGGKKNQLESGMLAISALDKMPKYIKSILEWFHSHEFTSWLGETIGIEGLIPDSHFSWSGMRTMLPGAHQLIHSDARRCRISGLRKELTCLIYLGGGPKDAPPGPFEVWSDDMSHCVRKIDAIANRSVVFLNLDKSYHGVPSNPSIRNALTFSVLASGDSAERYKALFVRRPSDPVEVEELGFLRSRI
jgi:hypothetical protein